MPSPREMALWEVEAWEVEAVVEAVQEAIGEEGAWVQELLSLHMSQEDS